MPDQPKSKRLDSRGHWPAGKRRNPPRGPRARLDTDDLVVEVRTWCDGAIGRRGELADHLGVHRKSLWRWLAGVDRPGPDYAARMALWLREQRQRAPEADREASERRQGQIKAAKAKAGKRQGAKR